MHDGGRLSLSLFRQCQACGYVRDPISRQDLGFIGLVHAFALSDLLGAALFRSFAMLGSNGIRVDQFLSEGRFPKQECSQKSEVPK